MDYLAGVGTVNRDDECASEKNVHQSTIHCKSESANLEKDSGNRVASKEPQSRHVAAGKNDINQRLRIEAADNNPSPENAEKTMVSFSRGDPENPLNWSTGKKIWVVIIGVTTVINSTFGSGLPAGAVDYLADYFGITNQQQLVLPVSVYLVGYVFGPLLFGPLSEEYGRRTIMVATFVLFTVFTLACAVAPTWPAFLIFRFIAGVNASSAITVTGGLYADLYDDPVTRGRAMAFFMAATAFGPQLAPSISGFISVITWRWTFWVGFILAGLSMIVLLLLPETYGPVILKNRARRIRKETGSMNTFAPIELEKKGAKQMVTVTLARPLRMFFFEAIVLFTCLYLSLAYGIFYLFFEAYPLIFQGIYGMTTGISGLAFLPIAVGAVFASGIFLYYDSVLQKAKQNNARWSSIEEYRRLPLACIGGPLIVLSLFWLGWTASPHIHWIVPMLAGLWFGIGFLLIFMALLNYLTDAYEIFAASAMAAASCCRSIFGTVVPLAAQPMYNKLGIAWASSLLGFISLAMSIIPFVFIRYGDRIRASSRFCQYLAEQKMKNDRQEELAERKAQSPIEDNKDVEKC